MRSKGIAPRGRGASGNPPNRFEALQLERAEDWNTDEDPLPRTQCLRDHSASIITYNDSPDVGFSASLNPYRGCEHGCAYCYARPTHEYLGFSSGLDFETRIMVKENAPDLLRSELMSSRWKPQVLAMSGVTDCYQPVERRLRLTRRCLEVLAEFLNPVVIITKNHLVTRDVDCLRELARHSAAMVCLSVTTLDSQLASRLEPRASQPAYRIAAIQTLAAAGVPVRVLVAPVIPGLNDHEIPNILRAAREAGARWASRVVLRLPHAVAPLFEQWLGLHAPEKKEKILARIRAMRSGQLNDPNFGSRMRGTGILADQIADLFRVACQREGLALEGPELSTAAFRRSMQGQIELF